MTQTAHPDSVLIVDFGSQVTQLIARRVRESGVYCEIVPFQSAEEGFHRLKPKAIILSGSPASTLDEGSPRAPQVLFAIRRLAPHHRVAGCAQTLLHMVALVGALHARFGGEAGLTALMETFMVGLVADPRTKPFFANADQERVKRQLTEQFCVILGGDCTYTGRDMKSSHRDMQIGRGDFNALVEHLQDAMDAEGVPTPAQNRLLARLAPMRGQVIDR